ncbi:MAG: phosphocholine cytidylyltransferase family protein [Deltaproteobacteria bacterium]|nr:phosphocholine cytidylyltransferase family protein [Deltaproteobacteria bacterium]
MIKDENMQAVVLCAGKGRRLYPLTKDMPKSLLSLGEKTILEHIIENLYAAGIDKIFLVTGYNRELIEDLMKNRKYSDIHFIVNEKFASTNTAFSLNLALREIDSDFILINGDVVFDKDILLDLISHPEENCVVVDKTVNLNEEEVKVIALNGHIRRIGKELDPGDCLGEAIGMNKISRGLIHKLSQVFDDLENKSEFHHFFEKGFDRVCENNGRFGILLTDKAWIEIDTMEDFFNAQNNIYPKIDSRARFSHCMNKP